MTPSLAVSVPTRLVHLAPVDIVIVAFYFVLVLAIGFYLRSRANTGEDFFMAGREMTAWIAGLSFLSANLGSLELMGWAAAAYQYGILAAHWYWIGAIPAMLFLGIVMMPFYYISKTHSVPGYLKLRFGEASRTLSSRFVRFHDRADERHQHVFHGPGHEGCPGLGHSLQHLGFLASRSRYMSHWEDCALPFSTKCCNSFSIWAGAMLIPILGLIEAGGWSNLKVKIAQNASSEYTHLWSTLGTFSDNPMGIHWTGIVFGLGAIISFGYWTTDFLVVQRVLAAKDIRAAKMAPIIGAAFKMMVPFIVILPGLLGIALLPTKLMGETAAVATGGHSYNEVLPLMLARYCGPGLARTRRYRADRRLHVRHGRQCERLHHRVDL